MLSREGLSPAESNLKWSCCEVHSGADVTNVVVAEYHVARETSSKIRVTTVIRYEQKSS